MNLYLVLGGIAAVLLGFWLGMPGRYGSDRYRGRRGGIRGDGARNPRHRRPSRRWRVHRWRADGDGVHDPRHLAELESAMGRRGSSKTAKRYFTLFQGLSRAQSRASKRRRSGQARFRTAAPDPQPRAASGSRASGPGSGDRSSHGG